MDGEPRVRCQNYPHGEECACDAVCLVSFNTRSAKYRRVPVCAGCLRMIRWQDEFVKIER